MKIKRILCIALSAIMLIAVLAGCQPNNDSGDTAAATPTPTPAQTASNTPAPPAEPILGDRETIGADMDPVTLNIRLMNEIRNWEIVVEEFQSRVADDPILSKISINIDWVPGGDFRDRITMTMATGDEDLDLTFIGGWHGLDTFIRDGMLTDIANFFGNDQFPGLMSAFPSDLIDGAATFVPDGSGGFDRHVYRIPIMEAFFDMRGVQYREDLRVKHGVPEITNFDGFRQYLTTVVENEPDIEFGWSMWNGFFMAFTPHFSGNHDNVFPFFVVHGHETPFYVGLSADATQVLSAVVVGDTEENFSKMPAGYQHDFIREYHHERLNWVEFLSPGRGTTEGEFGYSAAGYATVTEMIRNRNNLRNDADLLEIWPDASIRLFITETDQRNLVPGAIVSPMTTNNFICVPAWSPNVDATMYFLDWMFASRENKDLFQFGIEGLHWEAVGDNAFRVIDLPEDDRFIMQGYSFTWNPNYIRYDASVLDDPEMKAMFDYQNSRDAYTRSPLAGFTFDPSPVSTQMASVSALSGELMTRFAIYGDRTDDVIDTWYADAVTVGLDDIRMELINQIQTFLDIIHGG